MEQVDSAAGYAGDLLPDEAWALLKRQPGAQLVDVRTTAEWNFVGLPDLSSLGRTAHLVEWQRRRFSAWKPPAPGRRRPYCSSAVPAPALVPRRSHSRKRVMRRRSISRAASKATPMRQVTAE